MERVRSKTLCGSCESGSAPTLLEGPIAPLREAQPTEHMVVRVLVGRDKLFQTRAVIGWEDGEEDGRPGRRSPTLTSHHDACDGGADQLR